MIPDLEPTRLSTFLSRALLLDLETGPTGTIHKIGAISGGGETFLRQGRFDERVALAELDRFAAAADLILGHNLLGHDLHALRARQPALNLLRRPVVDTLFLSPLAFPENPYHRLVKDYKLVRDSVADPLADCRLAGQVFQEQWTEFSRRAASGEAGLLALYRYCFQGAMGLESAIAGGTGIALAFAALGIELPDAPGVMERLHHYWDGRVCASVAPDLARHYLTDPCLRPALSYATAWLQVAGARSVLPPWVRHRFPATAELLSALRDRPCPAPDCHWCQTTHDPRGQLQRWFGLEQFRPEPRNPDGGSLQGAICAHGLADGSHLAILPTGGGKSLCFQLPALVRYLRRGLLTLVISPLQALMKDQVDNLVRKTGNLHAAALYGLLTAPERGEVMERVRLGEIAILYVSPEQLRNTSFRRVLESREIGGWVFDEAHCLSKWGHDFRPDYLYAARFIRELAAHQGVPVPPIACFTATAKTDVIAEVLGHFQGELGRELRLFQGGVRRDNLSFEVRVTRRQEKEARLHAVLAEHLGEPPTPDQASDQAPGQAATGRLDRQDRGAAVVYGATRRRVEGLAEYLSRQGWAAAAFHAGLRAPDKRRIQDEFITGKVQVVCATNAFGMGVDKEDVRLVVHVDIPGSLENYVQEAGRAGRDQAPAHCILLYDEQDVEEQFRLAAGSELSRADIMEILRGLRRARRDRDGSVVLTAGELLHEGELRVGFDTEGREADTRVRTAIAWLERAGFVERNENRTRVFQGRPAVANLEEAERRIAGFGLSAAQRGRWLAVLAELFNCDPDEGLTADELAQLPAFRQSPWRDPEAPDDGGDADSCLEQRWDRGETAGQRVLRTLHDMARVGLLHQGPQQSAFLRHKVANPSTQILAQVCAVERAMLAALREEAPDADDRAWHPLSIRRLNQRLCDQWRDQGVECNPELLRDLLAGLARDGSGLAGSRGSLEFR